MPTRAEVEADIASKITDKTPSNKVSNIDDGSNRNLILDYIDQEIDTRQEELVSGTNIKTVNGESLLGEGNIDVGGIQIQKIQKTTITHSELLSLNTTPKVLLPSVSDIMYIPSAIIIKYNDNSGWGNGGGNFLVDIKNNTNTTNLGSFGSQLGGTSFNEQFRTLTSGAPTNIVDTFFGRRVELSLSNNPTSPVSNETTLTVYLIYSEIAL
jgi:flagellin-like hook-associated protein FlgL